MNKFIICFIFVLFIKVAAAQDELKAGEAKATKNDSRTFNIASLDGKNEQVKIIPDYVNHVLMIKCSKSTISIADFWGVPPEIHMLNKNFIEIDYAVRGGSNLGLGRTLILCINGSKINEAVHFLKYSNSDYGDSKTDYHIKLSLKGDNKNNFRLNISIHDEVNSKPNPEENYTYDNQTVLNFDTRRNVFYSVKEPVYDHFIKPKKSPNQKIGGDYPEIILGKESYFFINNRWYQSGINKQLEEF